MSQKKGLRDRLRWRAQPSKDVSDRLAVLAQHGWVLWLVIAVTVGGFVFVVVDHIPTPQPDPDVALCKQIDLDQRELDSSGLEGREYLEALRMRVARQQLSAQPAGQLAHALADQVETIDVSIAVSSQSSPESQSILNASAESIKAGYMVADACLSIGYRLPGFRADLDADGSISPADTKRYCQSALEFLQVMARSKVKDQHVVDVMKVFTTRSLKGLPIAIYLASRQLELVVLYAKAGVGYPPGERAAYEIRDYCVGSGETGWPPPK